MRLTRPSAVLIRLSLTITRQRTSLVLNQCSVVSLLTEPSVLTINKPIVGITAADRTVIWLTSVTASERQSRAVRPCDGDRRRARTHHLIGVSSAADAVHQCVHRRQRGQQCLSATAEAHWRRTVLDVRSDHSHRRPHHPIARIARSSTALPSRVRPPKRAQEDQRFHFGQLPRPVGCPGQVSGDRQTRGKVH